MENTWRSSHRTHQSRLHPITTPYIRDSQRTSALLPQTNMEEILKQLAEVSVCQQQFVEHLADCQGRAEQEITALCLTSAQRTPLPDPRINASKLWPKMTTCDDVEAYLQMFEVTATTEGWERESWAKALAPLLTGEAQRAYFSLPTDAIDNYDEVKREILARMGLSPVCASQMFHDWEFKPRQPAQAQAGELMRIVQHWLLDGSPSASQVAEWVVIDRFQRALPQFMRQVVSMQDPKMVLELVEAIELADAAFQRDTGERAPPFPRRVVQERRVPEGTHGWQAAAPSTTETVAGEGTSDGSSNNGQWERWSPGCSKYHRADPGSVSLSDLPAHVTQETSLQSTHSAANHRVPFERIGMDLVGPLPKSGQGHEHILVIVNYATRYPEAVPLRKATWKSITSELFLLSSRVGIPSEILTNQGPFMSRLKTEDQTDPDLCLPSTNGWPR
ncbi:hypothetical protein QQF64_017181 [Cirrhinus molitorella]|uniref:SCAN box domain-containing protein n=1 Tax=Cirrhinus molitorella TaxID=172907 RepID=A0ABR3LI27_9TELE